MYHKNQPNAGIYTSPMDGMGNGCPSLAIQHPADIRDWLWTLDLFEVGKGNQPYRS